MWIVSLYVWQLRALYELAVDHDIVQVAAHACFFAFGAALWLALLGPPPKPVWFGNGAGPAWVADAGLANGFLWATHPLYAHYAATSAAAGRSAAADQAAAGGVMLVEQTAVVFGLLARMLRDAGCRQELAEPAARQCIALEPRRIARAVAAEQDERSAKRLRGRDTPCVR